MACLLRNAFQCDAAPCGPDDMAYAIIGLAFWVPCSQYKQNIPEAAETCVPIVSDLERLE